MVSSFNRPVLVWLQTLDLSQPYTNPRLDFASGFLIAEICSHYINAISMHSFSNFLSIKMRNDNWNQLSQAFARDRIPVSQQLVNEVIKREKGSAIKMIEVLYSWFTRRSIVQPKIGDFSTTSKETSTTVQSIEPPPPQAVQVVEEAPKETPTFAPPPKRARFIGAPQAPRDQEAIAFQPASVVKTGPGFSQLRNQGSGNQNGSDDDELRTHATDLISDQTPENIEGFLILLNNTSNLIKFLRDLPTLDIIKLLLIIKKDLSPQIHMAILQSLGQYFIPAIDFATIPCTLR